MEVWTIPERTLYAARQALGLGAVAGLFELVALLARSRDAWGALDVWLLGFGAASLSALVAAAIALVLTPVHTLRRSQPAYRNVSLQLGLAGGAIAAVQLLPGVEALLAQDRLPAAVAVGVMPLGIAGLLHFNARFWLARQEAGKPTPVGWNAVAWGAVGVSVLLAGVAWPQRDTGGAFALEGDPNVLLITVDALRCDHVGACGGPAGLTPAIDALAAEGMDFDQAVTPSTSTVASHAAMLTALHPLRHRALDDLHALPSGAPSVVERFEEEGWATAAFVSTVALRDVGLEQGFRIYDDGMTAFPRGFDHLTLVDRLGLGGLSRPGADTVSRFESWLEGHAARPFVAWVHLADTLPPWGDDPSAHAAALAAGERDPRPWAEAYAEDVRRVDALVARLVAALDAHRLAPRTLVVVAGAHGVGLGEHGLDPFAGVGDPLVHVPLVLRAPGRPTTADVTPQVRLMDVAATWLSWAELDAAETFEGLDLLAFGDGRRSASTWTSLLGRDGAGGRVLGLRQPGVKAILDADREGLALYDLDADPDERDDLAATQEKAARQAAGLLRGEAGALEGLESLPARHGARRAARLARLRTGR